MAQDEKRRQMALQRKKQKDKERRKASQASSFFETMNAVALVRSARRFPVFESLINDNWQDQGMANILLSRRQPDGNYVIGVYLTDMFCLGVKNTFCNANISSEQYASLKLNLKRDAPLIPCDPRLAKAIIYGAIDYAKQWGFEPQKDFSLSRFVLGERMENDPEHSVSFGKDGKPCYISGPDDDVDFIMNKLRKTAGDGNFEYIANVW